MVNSRSLTFVFFVLVIAGNLSCKKNPFDYRNKYTGNFELTCTTTSWSISTGPPSQVTTTYSGKVYYVDGPKDRIRLEYGPGKVLGMEINRDGSLYFCNDYVGEFSGKNTFNIEFSSANCGSGSTHNGSASTISGVRQ